MKIGESLIAKIHEGADFTQMHALLRSFALAGVTPQQVVEAIDALRMAELSVQQDDLLLDLLDVATGFCQPTWRIWHA